MITELYSQWQTDVSKPHHGKIDILYTQNILRQGASLGVRNSCLSVTSQNHDDKGERGYTKKKPKTLQSWAKSTKGGGWRRQSWQAKEARAFWTPPLFERPCCFRQRKLQQLCT